MSRFSVKACTLGLLTAIATSVGVALLPTAATAQTAILETSGDLRSLGGDHVFSGTAGQSVAISLTSTEFDGGLTLLAPNGMELATNEDYARSINPTIVITLPSTGDYQIMARSPYGAPGAYTVQVRVATAFDQAYFQGVTLMQAGNYTEAIAAFTEATEVDSTQPVAFLDLADAVYAEATRLKPEEQAVVVANYRRAAELYEQQGNTDMAQMLRDQLSYLEAVPSGGF